jgi:predicted transcriptional regulator
MDIFEISEQALIFSPEEAISKVSFELCKRKKHIFLVSDGKELGIATDYEIIKRNIDQPHKVKIRHLRKNIRIVKAFGPEPEPSEVIEFMLENSLCAVPVAKNNEIRMLSDTKILGTVPKDDMKGTAADILVLPKCIHYDSTLDDAHSMMRQAHTDKLVVVGNSGLAEGVIDGLDMLKVFVAKERAGSREVVGEKTNPGNVKISSHVFMETNFLKAGPDTPIKKLAEMFVTNNTDIIVIEDGRLYGVVTPYNILRHAFKKADTPQTSISGLQAEDEITKSIIHEEAESCARNLGRMIPVDCLAVDIKRFEKSGAVKAKYSIKAKLITEKGFFFSESHEWNVSKAVKAALSKIEKEVLKKVGKEHRR